VAIASARNSVKALLDPQQLKNPERRVVRQLFDVNLNSHYNLLGETQMQSTRILNAIAVAALGAVLGGSAAMAVETKPTLTLDVAKKMAAGCEKKAAQEKWRLSTTAQTWCFSSTWTAHSRAASTSRSTRR
jgi:hypothetical protein